MPGVWSADGPPEAQKAPGHTSGILHHLVPVLLRPPSPYCLQREPEVNG